MEFVKRPRTWIALALVGLGLLVAPRLFTLAAYRDRIYTAVEAVPSDEPPRIAIVFGAGLAPHREPSPVLYDRVATAVDLYNSGRVRKLLLTGDNRFVNYNEPEAMRSAALRMGVPDSDLVLDYAGRSTYDSCYRAANIFQVRRAIVVTQSFHLDRALYICNSLGIDAIGVPADRREYSGSSLAWWSIREIPATMTAWIDLYVWHPTPVLGDRMPIDEAEAIQG